MPNFIQIKNSAPNLLRLQPKLQRFIGNIPNIQTAGFIASHSEIEHLDVPDFQLIIR